MQPSSGLRRRQRGFRPWRSARSLVVTFPNSAMVTVSPLREGRRWTRLGRGARWCFKVAKRERFLTHEELCRLGQALQAAPAERLASTHAAAAIRLVLTGCRRKENLGLRSDDLNFETGEMQLPDR